LATVVPGFDIVPVSPLAPRDGAASGSAACFSASLISGASGIPLALPVASSMMMVDAPARSI